MTLSSPVAGKITTVLFDLDGTLVDTAPDIAAALNRLRHQHQLKALPYPLIRECISKGSKELVKLALGQLAGDEDSIREHVHHFLQDYGLHVYVDSGLFDRMDRVLQFIEARGLKWGIVTNKPTFLSEALLTQMDLLSRSCCLICGDTSDQRKPHPKPLLMACEQAACQPQQAVYIGDDLRDIQAGKAAGTATIAARFGYIDPEDDIHSWHADHIVDNPLQIIDWLENQC